MEIIAAHLNREIDLDARHPAVEWRRVDSISFCSDWQGNNPNPALETSVRILWSVQTLYLRFECRYRDLYVFDDSDANGRRNQLWDRDVAEVFLQADPTRPKFYREFEVSPNGMWVDLDIFPGGRADLKSGLQRSAFLDQDSHIWNAELAIPMRALTQDFDPTTNWKANFFRVEGPMEPRTYMAWQPTHTAQPNFHVPAAFGRLCFSK